MLKSYERLGHLAWQPKHWLLPRTTSWCRNNMGIELFCFSSWAVSAPVLSLQVELKQHLTYVQYLYQKQTLTNELDIENPWPSKARCFWANTPVGIDLSCNYWQLFKLLQSTGSFWCGYERRQATGVRACVLWKRQAASHRWVRQGLICDIIWPG